MSSFDSLTSTGLGLLDTAISQTVYTTVWTTKILAVSGQSTWEADYTITEVRTGNPADYFRAAFPTTTSGSGNRDCSAGPDVIIISPTDTADVDVSSPVQTAADDGSASALDDEPFTAILTDFYPDFPPPSPTSSAEDISPELAGGSVVPPGAAPFPEGEGTELRGPGSETEVDEPTTVQSALSILATGDSSRSHGGTGAHVDGNINTNPDENDSGLTMEDIIPLLSKLNSTSRPIPSIVTVGLPTESSEVEVDEAIFADDFDFDVDSGSASLRDGAVSSDLDASITPTATAESSSFTTVTILSTASEDDFLQRSALNSTSTLSVSNSTLTSIFNSTLTSFTTSTLTSVSTSSVTEDEEDTSTTTTTSSTRTAFSITASAPPRPTADDEVDESDAASKVGAPVNEEDGNGEYVPVTAAAQRAPTQSTTLLAVNAMLVGLWMLL